MQRARLDSCLATRLARRMRARIISFDVATLTARRKGELATFFGFFFCSFSHAPSLSPLQARCPRRSLWRHLAVTSRTSRRQYDLLWNFAYSRSHLSVVPLTRAKRETVNFARNHVGTHNLAPYVNVTDRERISNGRLRWNARASLTDLTKRRKCRITWGKICEK